MCTWLLLIFEVVSYKLSSLFQAVRQFGSDFAMIQQMFPGRTRQQIKSKYKTEERKFPNQMADALMHRAKGKFFELGVFGDMYIVIVFINVLYTLYKLGWGPRRGLVSYVKCSYVLNV